MSMFCYQCEQTAGCSGCTTYGVCGKDPETAALQDLLLHAVKGIAFYASSAWEQGKKDSEINAFIVDAIFTTVTNVDFDPERIAVILHKAVEIRDKARKLAGADEMTEGPAAWQPASSLEGMIAQGQEIAVSNRIDSLGPDVAGLQELLTYGIKGAAAYVFHARVLGRENDEIYEFFFRALKELADGQSDAEALLGLCLECGKVNFTVMELLDTANTTTFGHPEPTEVLVTVKKGKALLVSGHDLQNLDEILKQTEGKGINVYTHGEMLPAHGYPELKKYSHLVGNYGGAWQDQQQEFDAFPGAIILNTNCIQKPKESYMNRIFTCDLVAWPGVTHIDNHDYTPVINAALEAEGFTEDEAEKKIIVGFGHNAVTNVAPQVVQAVKDGAIKHFFLVGGCDGAKSGRNYYTDFAQAVPDDCVILTLACGKYRFNKFDFGDIGGIPRLLDVGQCNDAYSAIKIAVALSEAFDCGVNDLPLSMILSWYEQKAVVILLTLLHLGITNIKLGPTLPAFVGPEVLKILVDKFALAPVTEAKADLEACLGQ